MNKKSLNIKFILSLIFVVVAMIFIRFIKPYTVYGVSYNFLNAYGDITQEDCYHWVAGSKMLIIENIRDENACIQLPASSIIMVKANSINTLGGIYCEGDLVITGGENSGLYFPYAYPTPISYIPKTIEAKGELVIEGCEINIGYKHDENPLSHILTSYGIFANRCQINANIKINFPGYGIYASEENIILGGNIEIHSYDLGINNLKLQNGNVKIQIHDNIYDLNNTQHLYGVSGRSLLMSGGNLEIESVDGRAFEQIPTITTSKNWKVFYNLNNINKEETQETSLDQIESIYQGKYIKIDEYIPTTSISVSVSNNVLNVDTGISLTTTVSPQGATDEIIYESDHPEIVSVSQTGVIYANQPGIATITATSGNYWDSVTIYVRSVITAKANGCPGMANNTYYTGFDGKLMSMPNWSTLQYHLIKWTDLGGDEITLDTVFSTNTTIYAQWEPNNVTVSFETFGGGNFSDQTILYGETATKPTTDPSREKCTFTGWYADETMSTLFDFTQPIESDTIIYAGYFRDIWTDTTVDDSVANIKGVVELTDVYTATETSTTVFENNVDVTYSNAMTDEVLEQVGMARTAAETYVMQNDYTYKTFQNSTFESNVWDHRKYETKDEVYSETHHAIVREHVASGSYGKLTLLQVTVFAEYNSNLIFPDVERGKWYSDGIEYCKTKGIMSGYSSGEFGLNDAITRGQIATMLYRLAGEPDTTGLENPFTDVPEGKYYTNAIKWAVSKGITTGYTATTFGPNNYVTRQELAVFMARYAKNILGKNIDSTYDITGIADYSTVSTWAISPMKYIMEKGVITGDMALGYARILPKANATRATAATMFMRFCKNIVGMS